MTKSTCIVNWIKGFQEGEREGNVVSVMTQGTLKKKKSKEDGELVVSRRRRRRRIEGVIESFQGR